VSVLIRVNKQKAILRGAEWRSASSVLEADLNNFTRLWVRTQATSEDLAGNIEDALVKAVVEQYDARILGRIHTKVASTQKRYFPLRQFSLFDM